MSRVIDIKYVIRKMIKWLWLAVIVGLLAAGVYYLAYKAESRVEETSSMSFEQYDGLYLNKSLANRYAMYRIIWKESPLEKLPEGGQRIADYTESVGRFIQQRLKSGIFSHKFYIEMKKQYPEIETDQKNFNIYVIEDEMLNVSVDRQSVLWITIKSPMSLSKDKYTDNQLCAYRDLLYQLVTAEVDSGSLTHDLSIKLERVAPETELDVSEQEYILKLENPAEKVLSKKKLVIFALLGVLLVEGIVFLIAVLNNTVKGIDDLKNNTDLNVMGAITKKSEPQDWEMIAAKTLANVVSNDAVYVVAAYDGTPEEETKQLLQGFANLKKEAPQIVGTLDWEERSNVMLTASNSKVLLLTKRYITNYGMLREMAESFQQIHAEVIGAVVKE